MRALVVASPPMDEAGGVASVCRAQVAALEQAGFATQYLSTRSWHAGNGRSGAIRSARLSGALEPLRAYRLDATDYDVVVTNGPIGWGIRASHSVHFYHGTYVGQARAIRPYVRRRGYAKLRYIDSLVFEKQAGKGKICLANSEQTAAEVREFFGHESDVVWCPVDVTTFVPGPRDARLLTEFGLVKTLPVCLFVGAGRPMKGEGIVYSIIDQLPKVQWLVIGDAIRLPDHLREHVIVRPGVTANRMPALLRSVDLVVAPSLYEPFGLLVAEALACGKPVVTSSGGVADLLLADPQFEPFFVGAVPDAASVMDRISRILDGIENADRMALKGRAAVKRVLAPDVWRTRFLRAARVG
jgi:glycosyltransferase involved in cell wall biosynthesis